MIYVPNFKVYCPLHRLLKDAIKLPSPDDDDWQEGSVFEVRLSQGKGGPFASLFTWWHVDYFKEDLKQAVTSIAAELGYARIVVKDQAHNTVYTVEGRATNNVTVKEY